MERLREFAKKAFNGSKPDDNKNANLNSGGRVVNKNPPSQLPRSKEEYATELETDFKERKFSYTWRIKDMHLCNMKCGEYIQSAPFSTRFCEEITWVLRLYRKSQIELPLKFDKKLPPMAFPLNQKKCDHIEGFFHPKCENYGLFLHRISNHPVSSSMRYRLVCERHISSKMEIHSYPDEDDWELFDLNSEDQSLYGTNDLFCRQGYEGPETLVIRCDIYIIGVFNMGSPNNCGAGTLQSDTLIHDLQEMLETGKFSDVTLEARDLKFRAHKGILASRSPVFAAMFQHDMQEARSNIIQVKDIEPEVLRSLLQYIYTGRVEDFDVEKALSLYAASDKYLMEELKKWCIELMLRNMSVENVCRMAVLADMHPGPELKDAALYMFRTYSSDIFKRKEWNDLVKDANHNHLVSEILAYVSSDFTTDCGNK